jgi:hypothetical protein
MPGEDPADGGGFRRIVEKRPGAVALKWSTCSGRSPASAKAASMALAAPRPSGAGALMAQASRLAP